MNLILTPNELYELMYSAADNAMIQIEVPVDGVYISAKDRVDIINRSIQAASAEEMPLQMRQLIGEVK
jgi:hypothetical protein